MDTSLDLTALAVFALASSVTPGPNNLLVMRSGARFGLRPTGPHIVGVEAGLVGIGTLSMIAWTVWGATVHRVLRRPLARRAFNVAMAAIVAGTAFSTLRTT